MLSSFQIFAEGMRREMRFSSETVDRIFPCLEELIEYVNADLSNKFTLVINSTISRPGTSSGLNNLPPIGRKASRSYSHSNAAADFENGNDILMTSQNDEEFFKVLSLCSCCSCS